jgi:hypothetical protein
VTIGGDAFVSSQLASQRFGVNRDELRAWHKRPCPELDGRKLRAQKVAVVEAAGGNEKLRRKKRWVWHAGELAKLKAGSARELDWLTQEEVRERYGYSFATVYKWRTKGCPELGGRKLGTRRERRDNGHRRREYSRPDLDHITAARNAEMTVPEEAAWIGYRAATAEFGYRPWQLSDWATKKCDPLGRKLASKRIRARVGNNRVMVVTRYSRADLEAITGRRHRPLTAPVVLSELAEPAKPEARTPAAKSKSGRPRSPKTEAVLRFCYEEFVTKARKRSRVFEAARSKFGAMAPKQEPHVAVYARRYAKRYGLPLERKKD